MRRIGKLFFCLCVVMLFATACGDKKEETTVTSDNSEQVVVTGEAVSGDATDGETVSGDAVSAEAVEATEVPEETEEPIEVVTYDVEAISKLLDDCLGIRNTSGETLKYATAAAELLDYVIKEDLCLQNDPSIENFNKAFSEAYDKLDKKQKKELKYNLREEIMPIITDSFQDSSLYMADFEDAGVAEAWKESLAYPRAKDSWSVLWEAYEQAS